MNLGVIPGKWGLNDVSLDYKTFRFNAPSFKLSKGTRVSRFNNFHEQNIPWLPTSAGLPLLKPGDRVFMAGWIKSTLPIDGLGWGPGMIFGFDWYGERSRLWQINPANGTFDYSLPLPPMSFHRYTPFGSDWTYESIDIIVPDREFTQDSFGKILDPPQHVIGLVPLLTANWRYNERDGWTVAPLMNSPTPYDFPAPCDVWFSDFELYINPEYVPEPEPEPPRRTLVAQVLPARMVYPLWRLREKFITAKVHRKLHPLL